MSRKARNVDKGMAMRDLLFNLSLVFAVLMIVALLLITSDEQKQVERPAEYLLTMTWDDYSKSDIDLHILFDEKTWVYYYTKQNQHIHLERDDLGVANDYYTDELGRQQTTFLNREVITIREKVSGQYIVNAHLFSYNVTDKRPIEVHVELLQLNPYKIIANNTVSLYRVKEEQTVFSFVVDAGEVVEVDLNTQLPIIQRRKSFGNRPLGGLDSLINP